MEIFDRVTSGRVLLALASLAFLASIPADAFSQPIFRTPKIGSADRPVIPVDTNGAMAAIKKVSSGKAAPSRFQLPKLGSISVPKIVPKKQDTGFKNPSMREVGVDGDFLPGATETQLPEVQIEMPDLDLEALGIVEPDGLGGIDKSDDGANSIEPLPLSLGDDDDNSAEKDDAIRRENVVENYSDGKPRLIRSVAMDSKGNYYNDGPWVVKNRDGQIIAAGRYKKGVMNGQWGRRHLSSEGGLFVTKPFISFQEPFDSIANFKDGKLDGQWAIYDRSKRTVFEINYDDGKRDGNATWFYPDTTRMRAATFKNGVLHGEVSEWNEDGRLTSKEYYHEGRKVVRNTSFYRPKVPREEAYYLDVKLEQDGYDNWWEAKPAPYLASGDRVQAGQARAWYANRQLQYRGQFRSDKPVGQFFWWHENGNRSTVGQFDRDGNRTGRWIWWHENGMKQIEGVYRNGRPAGSWRSWDEDGQLIKNKDYDSDREAVDPIENIESILSEPDESKAVEGSLEPAASSTGPDGVESSGDLNEGEADLPLPSPSGVSKTLAPNSETEQIDGSKSKAGGRESLGPALDESSLSDEVPGSIGADAAEAMENADEGSNDSTVEPFDLNDLLSF